MAKLCSLNVYCIGSEKNHIPEDKLLTCVLPYMLPLKVKRRFGIGLCCGFSWETLFWNELRREGGRGRSLSGVMSKDLLDCCRGVPNCYILTD